MSIEKLLEEAENLISLDDKAYNEFAEFIHHSEFGLAWHTLYDASYSEQENLDDNGFWTLMLEAASKMIN